MWRLLALMLRVERLASSCGEEIDELEYEIARESATQVGNAVRRISMK